MKELAQMAYEAYVGSAVNFRPWVELPWSEAERWRSVIDFATAYLQGFSADGSEREPSQLDRIEAAQKSILEELHKMADNQEQLDSELTTVEGDLAALGTQLTTTISDLEAKAAGSTIDFTPEVTRLSAIATTLTSLTASAAAADPGAPAPAASTPVAEVKPSEPSAA